MSHLLASSQCWSRSLRPPQPTGDDHGREDAVAEGSPTRRLAGSPQAASCLLILNILGLFFFLFFFSFPSLFLLPSGSSRAEEAHGIRKEVGWSLEAPQSASPRLRGDGSQRAPVAGGERGHPPYYLFSFVLMVCATILSALGFSPFSYLVALHRLAFAFCSSSPPPFYFFLSRSLGAQFQTFSKPTKKKFARWHRGQGRLVVRCGLPLPSSPRHLTQPCKQVCRECVGRWVGG